LATSGVSFSSLYIEEGVNRVGSARLQQIATAPLSRHLFYDGDGKRWDRRGRKCCSSTARSAEVLRAYRYSKIKIRTVQRQMSPFDGMNR